MDTHIHILTDKCKGDLQDPYSQVLSLWNLVNLLKMHCVEYSHDSIIHESQNRLSHGKEGQ